MITYIYYAHLVSVRFEYSVCHGSLMTTKSAHRSYRKKRKVSQQRFHEHYGQHSHNGIDDWQFTLIEQCETHEQLKERETFWQHRLKTFYPYGLNEKKEYLY